MHRRELVFSLTLTITYDGGPLGHMQWGTPNGGNILYSDEAWAKSEAFRSSYMRPGAKMGLFGILLVGCSKQMSDANLAQEDGTWDTDACKAAGGESRRWFLDPSTQKELDLTNMVCGQRVVLVFCCLNRAWRTCLFARNRLRRCLHVRVGALHPVCWDSPRSSLSLPRRAVFSLRLRLCGIPVTVHMGLIRCSRTCAVGRHAQERRGGRHRAVQV